MWIKIKPVKTNATLKEQQRKIIEEFREWLDEVRKVNDYSHQEGLPEKELEELMDVMKAIITYVFKFAKRRFSYYWRLHMKKMKSRGNKARE